MNVIDNLSALLIDVEGHAVTRLIDPALTRNERRGSNHVSDEFAIGGPQIVHRRNVFLGTTRTCVGARGLMSSNAKT